MRQLVDASRKRDQRNLSDDLAALKIVLEKVRWIRGAEWSLPVYYGRAHPNNVDVSGRSIVLQQYPWNGLSSRPRNYAAIVSEIVGRAVATAVALRNGRQEAYGATLVLAYVAESNNIAIRSDAVLSLHAKLDENISGLLQRIIELERLQHFE
jgi:hypothetical protein